MTTCIDPSTSLPTGQAGGFLASGESPRRPITVFGNDGRTMRYLSAPSILILRWL
ncbi:MAG: hypothetical protein HY809_08225 [Nitrospirae bacterium]|nr:hypothetical protein [Nitrospirota bacterium]